MEFSGINRQYQAYKQEIDQAIQQMLDEGCFIL